MDYSYRCLNNIANCGLEHFDSRYHVTEGEDADAILVRSASMKEMEFSPALKAIARAGARVHNIPLDRCAEEGIVVFNTPGANANGVKELVIAGMILASRDIVGGIEWLEQQDDTPDLPKKVEKQKKQFAGVEISGKRLGIIGLGAIGVMVANAAVHLGMKVSGYDPFLSINAAWNLSSKIEYVQDVDDIFRNCDYISLHVPLNDSTKGMISAEAIAKMKDGVVLLNFARDPLVEEAPLIEALKSGKIKKYVTDFVTHDVAHAPNTLVTPHLGASTQESEDNCAIMAVNELRDYLENGNIRHSVNYPECDMGVCTSGGRIAANHRNIPGILARITSVIGDEKLNITNIANKSRGSYAYTLIDTDEPIPQHVAERIAALSDILKVRIVK